jgi:acyl dehydratase
MTQVVASTETRSDGELLFETEWMIILFDQGNFGGPRPAKVGKVDPPADTPADFEVHQLTSPEQALIYRLSGDYNPLHIDAAFAEKLGFKEGPIMHGLCTFGHLARAVIQGACDGDGDRLKFLNAQFKKPAWPGDELVTQGWLMGSRQCPLTVTVPGRPDAILGNAYAEII